VRVALPGRRQPPAAVAVAANTPPPPRPPSTAAGPARTNSLGMVFVPVPGLTAEFSIWETRVRDFRVFHEATGHLADPGSYYESAGPGKRLYVERQWHEPAFAANADWPVRAISPRDALAFCVWLTGRERAAGLLPTNFCYRLPRDGEWSRAAGLTNEAGATALERSASAAGPARYYWGTNWPPPPGAGNFSGSETGFGAQFQIPGHRDAFPIVAPVGSFPAGAHGLFDLAGNVSEICEEWPPLPGVEPRFPRRGGSWERSNPQYLEVRYRRMISLQHSSIHAGFRVVRAPVDAAPPPK